MKSRLGSRDWAAPAAKLALVALFSSLAGLLAWQYAMPRAFESSFLLDHEGVAHFAAALHLPRPTVALAPYRLGFRGLLLSAWVSYLALVLLAANGAPLPGHQRLAAVAGAVGLVAAIVWPPSFSCDVYGYVAYGRLPVLYGQNPYVVTQKFLRDVSDPVGPFLRWNISSPYGPLWTSMCAAVAWALHGLYAQVVFLKLVAAAAVWVAAWEGGRVAERLAPGRGGVTLLAIGLNPLFLIEGAGNGHNDFVMMALVVAASGAAMDGRDRRSALCAGLAGAIKFLPLLLVPWLLVVAARARPRPPRRLVRDALVAGALALAPSVLAYVPFWVGLRTLGGLGQRWTSAQGAAAGSGAAATTALLVATYAAATALVLRGRAGSLISAWMAVATAIFLFAAGMWLPWYLSWIAIPALLRWSGRATIPTWLCLAFAILLTLRYAVPAGV
jgi:hypothetical protein